MSDWTGKPLYQVEKVALTDESAQRECARRWAAGQAAYGTGEKHKTQMALQWLRGFNREEDPYLWKGGNFAAPLRHAHRAGKRSRQALELLAAAESKA